MKKLNQFNDFLLAAVVAVGLSSCDKERLKDSPDSALLASSIEVIAAGPTSDAVVAVNACPKGMQKDSVAFSTFPSTVSAYLNTNYAGYSVQKSFRILTSSRTVDSYIAVIQFNGKPVAIKFDASGNFVKVLEQRERRDCNGDDRGKGWHRGGRFDARDGENRDSISLGSLPTAVKSYFATNYATDTLLHARVGKDGSYFVISANKVLYATVFSATGTFIKRDQLPPHPGKHVAINVTDLPARVSTYLAATYPGFVINKAFAFKNNSSVQGYAVFIDVSGTRYAIQFDASGAFVKVLPIR
ncbi:MAG: hypothetical protein K0S09_1111 [Sphingobacteriaceae bacterium]|jgi:hypothetical protein|nr:hypothetical protein [Sphingobacteriaceae bacterium]